MTTASAVIDALFGDPNLSVAAQWSAGGTGIFVPVRVIRRAPDRLQDYGGAQIVSDSLMIDVRASEVGVPMAGDIIVIGDERMTVHGEPRRDAQRLVWRLEVVAER